MNAAQKLASFFMFTAVAACGVQAQSSHFRYSPAYSADSGPYDYRWELYGGGAYTRFVAGPQMTEGANLLGFDVEGARYFNGRWAAAVSGRGYYGTSPVEANPYGISKPSVGEYLFMAGPQYRVFRGEDVGVDLHALAGGAYGLFNNDIKNSSGVPVDPEAVGFFKNQLSFGAAMGGSIDFNIRPRWAIRIAPDAVLTNYAHSGENGSIKAEYAAAIGVVYRFRPGIRR